MCPSLLASSSSHPFKHSRLLQWLVFVSNLCHLLIILLTLSWMLMDISVELPDINSIILTSRDHHSVIGWVEHSLHDGVSVTNESLEVVWY